MIGTPSERYNVHYPDGSVEQQTIVGPRKEIGERIRRFDGTWWTVVDIQMPKDPVEIVFEFFVEPAED